MVSCTQRCSGILLPFSLSNLSCSPPYVSSSYAKFKSNTIHYENFLHNSSLWWVSTSRKCLSSFFPIAPHFCPVILNLFPNKLYYYFYFKKWCMIMFSYPSFIIFLPLLHIHSLFASLSLPSALYTILNYFILL
jgi:hypothetical protein